jgi:hypothetical protein
MSRSSNEFEISVEKSQIIKKFLGRSVGKFPLGGEREEEE